MTPAEREQVRSALIVGITVMTDAQSDVRVLLGAMDMLWVRLDNAIRVNKEAITILDAEPAPVTDKDLEEAKAWLDREKPCPENTTKRLAEHIARIRKAAYEEGLRDGSKH